MSFEEKIYYLRNMIWIVPITALALIHSLKTTPLFVRFVYTYFLIHGVFFGFYEFYMPKEGELFKPPVHLSAAQSVVALILFPMLLRERVSEWILKGILLILCVDTIYLLCGGISLMTGPTFDSAFLAMALPMFWKHYKRITVIPLIGILVINGATAYFILFVMTVTFLYVKKWWKTASVLLACVVITAIMFRHSEFMSTGGRLVMWLNFMEYWAAMQNVYVGTGLGSFAWIGPIIHSGSSVKFVWMHNDWLQVMFEAGLIGFALLFGLLVALIRMYKKKTPELLTILGFAACMCLYSPLRFWLCPMFLLCALSSQQRNEPSQSVSQHPDSQLQL